ncbi:MAG: phosphate acyltransferase [Shimia sp.]
MARIVFPEAAEPRIATAIQALGTEVEAVPLSDDPALAEVLATERGVKLGIAKRMVTRPLYAAAAMVTAGLADAMVAGAGSPTRRVIEAAGLGIGLADGVTAPSSFFLMRVPGGREMIFADCAVTVDPDAPALASIAQASAVSAKRLLGEARVALLSFSTGTSGAGDSVDVVRAAAEETGFLGPIQADAALNSTIAATKGMGAGNANTLVFPSLDAGNIAYKLCQELAGAQAIGPVLQGFRRPVCDLSRGASVEDIVEATRLTIRLAG